MLWSSTFKLIITVLYIPTDEQRYEVGRASAVASVEYGPHTLKNDR